MYYYLFQVNQTILDQQAKNQEIEFYEVAMGNDRRFPETRTNVMPFINVGQNTTWTFYDLELTPGTGRYYFTVRATSKSFSTTTVSSNGFFVGFDGSVTCKLTRYLGKSAT